MLAHGQDRIKIAMVGPQGRSLLRMLLPVYSRSSTDEYEYLHQLPESGRAVHVILTVTAQWEEMYFAVFSSKLEHCNIVIIGYDHSDIESLMAVAATISSLRSKVSDDALDDMGVYLIGIDIGHKHNATACSDDMVQRAIESFHIHITGASVIFSDVGLIQMLDSAIEKIVLKRVMSAELSASASPVSTSPSSPLPTSRSATDETKEPAEYSRSLDSLMSIPKPVEDTGCIVSSSSGSNLSRQNSTDEKKKCAVQ